MKSYAQVVHEKDITTKEYVDGRVDECVPLAEATLTEAQKAQVRQNIGVSLTVVSSSQPIQVLNDGDIWYQILNS